MTTPSAPPRQTRLYRSRTDKMIGGVAGGIGAYLDIDAALIRLAWVLLTLAAGFGVILYIVAWIVIPEAPEGYTPEAAAEDAGGRRFHPDAGRWIIGGLLALAGLFLLVDQFFPWADELIVPMAVIAVGAGIIVYGVRR
jgi:phage shock protein C